MQMGMDDLEATQERILTVRVRKHLHRRAMQGVLRDDELVNTVINPFWRRLGYLDLFSYLVLELKLDEARADKITNLVMERQNESRKQLERGKAPGSDANNQA